MAEVNINIRQTNGTTINVISIVDDALLTPITCELTTLVSNAAAASTAPLNSGSIAASSNSAPA